MPTQVSSISHIEVRCRGGVYYVLVVRDVKEMAPRIGFKSAIESQANNVAKQFAKQYKCLVQYRQDDDVWSQPFTTDGDDGDDGPDTFA